MARGRQRLPFITGMWPVRARVLADSSPLIPVSPPFLIQVMSGCAIRHLLAVLVSYWYPITGG